MKRTLGMLLLLTLLLTTLIGCADDAIEPGIPEPLKPTEIPVKREDPKVDTTDYAAAVKEKLWSLEATSGEWFEAMDVDGGVAITGYHGTSTVVRIPERIGDKTVVAIADGAFETVKNDKNDVNAAEQAVEAVELTVLYIPDSVKTIGRGILAGNHTLTALRTPLLSASSEEEQYIGYLFGGESYRDNGKTPLTLAYVWYDAESETLSDYAFADCNKLVAVLLGERVTKIGNFAFSFCGSLK